MSINAIVNCMVLCALNPLAALAADSPQQTGYFGDQGNGTYRNPIIAADYSDPDVCRVGTDFYMAVSTFESSPGVTVLHSSDLVNWQTIGAAIPDVSKMGNSFNWNHMHS